MPHNPNFGLKIFNVHVHRNPHWLKKHQKLLISRLSTENKAIFNFFSFFKIKQTITIAVPFLIFKVKSNVPISWVILGHIGDQIGVRWEIWWNFWNDRSKKLLFQFFLSIFQVKSILPTSRIKFELWSPKQDQTENLKKFSKSKAQRNLYFDRRHDTIQFFIDVRFHSRI